MRAVVHGVCYSLKWGSYAGDAEVLVEGMHTESGKVSNHVFSGVRFPSQDPCILWEPS